MSGAPLLTARVDGERLKLAAAGPWIAEHSGNIERLVEEVAGSPLLMFIKEDEDLYPDLDYSPVAERTSDRRLQSSGHGRSLQAWPASLP